MPSGSPSLRAACAAAIACAALLATLAGCGAGNASTPASATSGSGSAATSTQQSGASRGTSLNLTGAVSASFTDPGSCTPPKVTLQVDWSKSIGSDLYLLQIAVVDYTGSGQYDAGYPGSKEVDVTLMPQGGTDPYDSDNAGQSPGALVVNSGGLSGTVNATMVLKGSGASVHVSGSWTCQP
jgi:hypothetical protein